MVASASAWIQSVALVSSAGPFIRTRPAAAGGAIPASATSDSATWTHPKHERRKRRERDVAVGTMAMEPRLEGAPIVRRQGADYNSTHGRSHRQLHAPLPD